MEIIQSEFKIETSIKQVELVYKTNGNVAVSIVFDFGNDKQSVNGDLFSLLGYQDTPIDRDQYHHYISVNKWMASKLLQKLTKDDNLQEINT